jgi:hypothetical protein
MFRNTRGAKLSGRAIQMSLHKLVRACFLNCHDARALQLGIGAQEDVILTHVSRSGIDIDDGMRCLIKVPPYKQGAEDRRYPS